MKQAEGEMPGGGQVPPEALAAMAGGQGGDPMGGGGMPPFKEKLKPEEIDNLVVFIRKTFQSVSNVKGGNASTDSIAPVSSDMKKDMPMDMPKR